MSELSEYGYQTKSGIQPWYPSKLNTILLTDPQPPPEEIARSLIEIADNPTDFSVLLTCFHAWLQETRKLSDKDARHYLHDLIVKPLIALKITEEEASVFWLVPLTPYADPSPTRSSRTSSNVASINIGGNTTI